jgi:isopropylmalate/isohomocitrate dehydrogenase-like protein
MKRICVLPGDGIGPEVISCATRVLEATGIDAELLHGEIGQSSFRKNGEHLPAETLHLMRDSDSCLFGAVTTPSDPSYESPVLRFRKELGLYANLRPVRSLVRISGREPVDLVIVRENTEGLYTQREVYDDGGVTTMRRVSHVASARIVRFAIDYALKNGRKRICCVHKANVLKESDGLFLSVFRGLMGKEGVSLEAEEQLVDSAAMKLVTEPHKFDVIVTLNLYGDIISDVAAGSAGGLGFAPSGNIGDRHSVFGPAHGSAPDIAGKKLANPTAAILSGAMMLRHIGFGEAAKNIEDGVKSVYESGHLTVDVGGRHDSESFTDHVVRKIREMPSS